MPGKLFIALYIVRLNGCWVPTQVSCWPLKGQGILIGPNGFTGYDFAGDPERYGVSLEDHQCFRGISGTLRSVFGESF